MTASQRIKLIRPDDWHVHLRQGPMLKTVLPFTSRIFARAIVMPNLKPPVTTTSMAAAYRKEIVDSLPEHSAFTPLMTLYLTDGTDPNDLERGHMDGVVTAAKLYPAHATTNSEHGVTDIRKIYPLLERMQRIGMPLLIHGEATDPAIDIFDREAVFIEDTLHPLRKAMPDLKMVLEHITTSQAADYVRDEGKKGRLAATITAHHLLINRNAMFQGGLRPHFYCLPVAKRETHRQALLEAAISAEPMFFLGTDTAPHPKHLKETACGCAGVFSAPRALEDYASLFDEIGHIDRLEAFASRFGPAFYGLPVNQDFIELERTDEPETEIKPILTAEGGEIVPFASPLPRRWRVVATA